MPANEESEMQRVGIYLIEITRLKIKFLAIEMSMIGKKLFLFILCIYVGCAGSSLLLQAFSSCRVRASH